MGWPLLGLLCGLVTWSAGAQTKAQTSASTSSGSSVEEPLTPVEPLTGSPTAPRKQQKAPTPTAPARPRSGAVMLPPPSNVPERAPFSGPAEGRAFPPPAGLAGLDVADPTAADGSLEESVQQLLSEAVVTTASKRRQRIADVPMTVAWIPAEELEGTGQFSLCDAVQYFPGMECRRGAMRKAAVSARGLGSNYLSNRLLLLKDGRPLTDPWTGQFYADETTPLTNLKQVEVIRGPAPRCTAPTPSAASSTSSSASRRT
jgi:outer membrane receptor protein involved in Fe transport